jgi:hypothetical protein
LARPCCQVEWDDDLLAARVADVTGLVVHWRKSIRILVGERDSTARCSLAVRE